MAGWLVGWFADCPAIQPSSHPAIQPSSHTETIMTNDTQHTNFADFLSNLSTAVAVALKTQDATMTDELAGHLTELVKAAGESNEPELAAYFGVLHGLLHEEDVTAAAARLVDPYRAGYERILQEMAEEPEEDLSDITLSDWVARLTSIVATVVRGDKAEDRAELEQAFVSMAEQAPAEDTEFHDFIAALRAVVRGEDTRALALNLQPPYREAFQSLLQLLAAEDTTDFAVQAILDRIQHNTVIALTQGNRELRLSVAEALADVEEKLPEDEPTTIHFRALLLGALALLLEREPPAAVSALPEPFAAAWQDILAAYVPEK